MKRSVKAFIICLMILLLSVPALAYAASDADEYLLQTRWEMTVPNWSNTSYMSFYSDGIGLWEIPARYVDATGDEIEYYDSFITYSFTWYTVESNGEAFITIAFEGEYPGYGWGCLHVPYKLNTYQLLWSPDFMLLLDVTHSDLSGESHDASGASAEKSIVLRKVSDYDAYHI